MRVVFLTQDDPLYILPFFDSFFSLDLEPIHIAGIFACRSMGNRKRVKLLRELHSLYGTVGFLKLLTLQASARISSLSGLDSVLRRPHSLSELAHKHGIPYERIDNPNSPENVDQIAVLAPDVLVSVACPYILKTALLNLPAQAAINIHHAPLPRYRGMMPTFWQMYHGETSLGITIHTMAERVDEGEILLQDSAPVHAGETMHQLIRSSKRRGATAMLRVLKGLDSGTPLQPITPHDEATYFTFPTAAEMQSFRRRGLRAI